MNICYIFHETHEEGGSRLTHFILSGPFWNDGEVEKQNHRGHRDCTYGVEWGWSETRVGM